VKDCTWRVRSDVCFEVKTTGFGHHFNILGETSEAVAGDLKFASGRTLMNPDVDPAMCEPGVKSIDWGRWSDAGSVFYLEAGIPSQAKKGKASIWKPFLVIV
jgi:hypothetical protein